MQDKQRDKTGGRDPVRRLAIHSEMEIGCYWQRKEKKISEKFLRDQIYNLLTADG